VSLASPSPEHGRALGGQLLVGRLRRSLDEAGEHDRGRDPLGTGPQQLGRHEAALGESDGCHRRVRGHVSVDPLPGGVGGAGPDPGRQARWAGTTHSRREPPRAGHAALPRAGRCEHRPERGEILLVRAVAVKQDQRHRHVRRPARGHLAIQDARPGAAWPWLSLPASRRPERIAPPTLSAFTQLRAPAVQYQHCSALALLAERGAC
jgi:hypothetical protein